MNTTFDATVEKLKKMLAAINSMNPDASLTYVQVAAGSTSVKAEAILRTVRQHAWEELCKINDWKSDHDAVIAYAVASTDEGGIVLIVNSPYELYAADELWRSENISAEDIAIFARLVPADKWKPL